MMSDDRGPVRGTEMTKPGAMLGRRVVERFILREAGRINRLKESFLTKAAQRMKHPDIGIFWLDVGTTHIWAPDPYIAGKRAYLGSCCLTHC